jgi:sulfur relay (sulfurtransferase) complex TusBCD TusD component (DsrE family)
VNVLVVLQGPAYGDERAHNGLRLAGSLAKRDCATAAPHLFFK